MEQNALYKRRIQDKAELKISDAAKRYLMSSAIWAQFLGIGYFIVTTLFIVVTIIGMNQTKSPYNIFSYPLFSVACLIIAALYILVAYFLYGFGAKAKRAIKDDDTDKIASSLSFLSKYFIVIGALFILLVGLILFAVFELFVRFL